MTNRESSHPGTFPKKVEHTFRNPCKGLVVTLMVNADEAKPARIDEMEDLEGPAPFDLWTRVSVQLGQE